MPNSKEGIVLGSRVSRWGSWICGTVVYDWGVSCLVEWDEFFSSYCRSPEKRTSYEFKDYLCLTDYYNECHNAWRMRDHGIPTVAPKWEGK